MTDRKIQMNNTCSEQELLCLKFQLRKLVLHLYENEEHSFNAKNWIEKSGNYNNITLKLNFHCDSYTVSLKEITAKVSIKNTNLNHKANVVFEVDQIERKVMKVTYKSKEIKQVQVKVYIENLSGQNFQYVGIFVLNLAQLQSEAKQRIRMISCCKEGEVNPFIKKVKLLHKTNQANKESSYAELRVLQSQSIHQLIQSFRFKSEGIKKVQSNQKMCPLKYQPRTHSEFSIQPFSIKSSPSTDKNQEHQQLSNQNSHFKSKDFKQRIYELLCEVKQTKKSFEQQNNNSTKDTHTANGKNLPFNMITLQRVNPPQQNQISKQKSSTTSFSSLKYSNSQPYLTKNHQIHQQITNIEKIQRLLKFQQRLERCEKIVNKSTQYLQSMYIVQNPQ